jgi:hypothetical protein
VDTVQVPGEAESTPLCSNAELCASIQRDLARITALFKLPLSLSSFLSLPEALVSAMVRPLHCAASSLL